ncbi:MAG: GntR family transcriptional regulator [Rhodospirillales bacterium]|jgi:DNA-binding GntR family transcriptional regulator|nr:GntR family transcriptional regulator [Rhodospirillales bacterium]
MKLSEAAHLSFKDHLFDGRIRPGQFISQRELAKLLGIPLGPVREALQRLEIEGLVQIVPQRGIQVIEASLRLIRDTYQLRMVIEKEAAAKFAEAASDSEIDALEKAHVEIVARAEKEGLSDALFEDGQAVDWGLHDTIVNALDNDIIRNIHTLNNERIKLIRLSHGKRTLLTPAAFPHTMKEHLAVIQTFRNHDPAAATAAMEHHLSTAMRRALGL